MPAPSHSFFAGPEPGGATPWGRLLAVLAALLLAWACGDEAPPAAPDVSALPPLPERRVAELPRGEERPLRELAIALTGEVRGEIDPCGCPTNPTGGFLRRRNLLEELRAETTVFHLDAGEMLLRGLATERPANRAERADLILDLAREVGLDAWTPGPSDLMAVGLDRLARLARANSGPRLVNASWRDEKGAPLLPAATVLRRDGLAVGVIGVSGGTLPAGSGVAEVLDPVAAAGDGLARLPDGLDLVVVLGVMPEQASHAVAAEVPGVDLVLTTAGESLDPPWSPPGGGALVVETTDRGRHVRVIRMVLGTTSAHPPVLRPPEQDWRDRLTLREQARRTGEKPPRLAELERRFAEEARGRNLAWAVTVPLEADLDEPVEGGAPDDLARAIERFKAHAMSRAEARAAAPPKPREPRYAASGACVNCHTKEMARWAFTKHARAWEALLLRREDDNPECIPCHSTGFGEPGGFGEPTETNIRKFKAVQCEACHGPMGGHPDDRSVHGRAITPERCTGCHDAANDPDFDFAEALPRATCQAPDGKGL